MTVLKKVFFLSAAADQQFIDKEECPHTKQGKSELYIKEKEAGTTVPNITTEEEKDRHNSIQLLHQSPPGKNQEDLWAPESSRNLNQDGDLRQTSKDDSCVAENSKE